MFQATEGIIFNNLPLAARRPNAHDQNYLLGDEGWAGGGGGRGIQRGGRDFEFWVWIQDQNFILRFFFLLEDPTVHDIKNIYIQCIQ